MMNETRAVLEKPITVEQKIKELMCLTERRAKLTIIQEQLIPLLKSKRLRIRARIITAARLFEDACVQYEGIPEKYTFFKFADERGFYTEVVAVANLCGSYAKFVNVIIGMYNNRGIYSRFFLSADQHFCMSVHELNLDNWLHNHTINHKPHRAFRFQNQLFKCDQYLPDYDLWIEMDGAPNSRFSSLTDGKKLDAYKQLGMNYLILTPEDMESKLKERLR